MSQPEGTRPRLRWRWILGLASSGLLFGALTITGAVHGLEYWVVAVLLASCALVLAVVVRDSPLRHGAMTGLLFGLAMVWSQALFLETYFANNPGYADIPIPFGMSARAFTAIFGPANSILTAAVVAVLAWIFGRLRARFERPGGDRTGASTSPR